MTRALRPPPDPEWRSARRAVLAALGAVGLSGWSGALASSPRPQGAAAAAAPRVISVLDFVPAAERKAILEGAPFSDAAAYVREAVKHLRDNSILLFPPGVYLMEQEINDPLLNRPFASVYFEGLSDISIFGHGAVLRRTKAVRTTGAVLVFRRCKRVGLYGLHYEGPPSRGNPDSGSLSNFFACEGVDVEASIDGGRAIAQFTSLDGGMDPSGASADTRVVGHARNSHYGVSFYHPLGENHHVHLRTQNVVRSLIVTGVRRLTGRVTSDRGTTDLMFIGRHGDPIQDVNLDYATLNPSSHAIRLQVRDENPMAFERIRIAGSIRRTTKASISIEEMRTAKTLVDGLDFSDLKIVGAKSHGVLIAPDAPATIRNISLGDVSAEASAIFIDNAARAKIHGIRVVGKTLRTRASSAVVESRNGKVDDILLLGCNLSGESARAAVVIRNGRRVRIDHCLHDRPLDLRGCEDVSLAAGNQRRGGVPGVADALEDGMSVLFVNLVRVSSDVSTVTRLNDGLPGQRLLIMGLAGARGRLSPGPRLQLDRDFELDDGRALELVCVATSPNGESVFREVVRHERSA